jgi:hypothetical protein
MRKNRKPELARGCRITAGEMPSYWKMRWGNLVSRVQTTIQETHSWLLMLQ